MSGDERPFSNPDPVSGPLPGSEPLPGPGPVPQPPDWWRCQRTGPVSGRYEGEMIVPRPGRRALDLRVDIDPRYANSPVMDRISGDLYYVFRFRWPGRPGFSWRIYQGSWIVDEPNVEWSRCEVVITGTVRFYKGIHPPTQIRVRVPWTTFSAAGPAEVTFTEAGGRVSSYSCDLKSDCFRDMVLEVDVCESVNAEPIVPSYDTHAHATRPVDLPLRTLTVQEAYREAGICVSIREDHTIIDDSADEFTRWSPAELHDAMETHFSQFSGGWPKWQMWGLLAGTFDDLGTGGIMFDAGAVYGGAGEPPDRQGFAVFRNHPWFNHLVAGTPANQDQAWAMRQFLYTWVHEAGHAFNFLHSWNKGRPESLSWMNYPHRVTDFWDDFRLRFDDEELIHIRHGDRAAVIMGGDPWASGGHLDAPPAAFAQLVGDAPIELLLRSKEQFDFMEPVYLEFRLKNLLADQSLDLDIRLNPEYGGVIVYIHRPDGRIIEYAPVLCRLSTPQVRTFKSQADAIEGEDRYSETIFLSYGSYGFYFDEPGQYLVRAVYQGAGDVLVPSNVHRLRIGRPYSREDERIAQDFFTYEPGMALYLNGSSSPHLKHGVETLQEMADRYQRSPLGASLSLILAQDLARPFFRVEENKLQEARAADPEAALELTERAMAQQKRDDTTFPNIAYHRLRRTRADLLAATGDMEQAKKELAALVRYLKRRGVNEPVLDEIREYSRNL